MKKKHNVVPGENWGTLSAEDEIKWLQLNCDQYLCEPHHLAGKGVYKCSALAITEQKDESDRDGPREEQ
jgi:hypothetical protein